MTCLPWRWFCPLELSNWVCWRYPPQSTRRYWQPPAPVHTVYTALEEVTLITWHLEWLNSICSVTWDFQNCGICDQQRLRSTCACMQTDQSICLSLKYSMTVKLLNEYHLEFLCITGGCTGLSESTLVKMPHCWKLHVVAHIPSSLRFLQSVKVPL